MQLILLGPKVPFYISIQSKNFHVQALQFRQNLTF